jgi:ribonuclease D
MISAVTGNPHTMEELVVLPGFTGPAARRNGKRWLEALARGRRTPEDELPPHSLPSDAPPPPRAWPDRDADAAARLAFARPAIAELSERLSVPAENLMTPDTVRRVLWTPPAEGALEQRLAELRARPWQIELVGPILREALTKRAGDPAVQPSSNEPADESVDSAQSG